MISTVAPTRPEVLAFTGSHGTSARSPLHRLRNAGQAAWQVIREATNPGTPYRVTHFIPKIIGRNSLGHPREIKRLLADVDGTIFRGDGEILGSMSFVTLARYMLKHDPVNLAVVLMVGLPLLPLVVMEKILHRDPSHQGITVALKRRIGGLDLMSQGEYLARSLDPERAFFMTPRDLADHIIGIGGRVSFLSASLIDYLEPVMRRLTPQLTNYKPAHPEQVEIVGTRTTHGYRQQTIEDIGMLLHGIGKAAKAVFAVKEAMAEGVKPEGIVFITDSHTDRLTATVLLQLGVPSENILIFNPSTGFERASLTGVWDIHGSTDKELKKYECLWIAEDGAVRIKVKKKGVDLGRLRVRHYVPPEGYETNLKEGLLEEATVRDGETADDALQRLADWLTAHRKTHWQDWVKDPLADRVEVVDPKIGVVSLTGDLASLKNHVLAIEDDEGRLIAWIQFRNPLSVIREKARHVSITRELELAVDPNDPHRLIATPTLSSEPIGRRTLSTAQRNLSLIRPPAEIALYAIAGTALRFVVTGEEGTGREFGEWALAQAVVGTICIGLMKAIEWLKNEALNDHWLYSNLGPTRWAALPIALTAGLLGQQFMATGAVTNIAAAANGAVWAFVASAMLCVVAGWGVAGYALGRLNRSVETARVIDGLHTLSFALMPAAIAMTPKLNAATGVVARGLAEFVTRLI